IAMGQSDLLSRFHFYEHAVVLFCELVNVHKEAIRLRVPPHLPWYDPSGKYEPKDILKWIDAEAGDIARRFDERNGNAFYAEWLRYQRESVERAQSIPIH